MQTANNKLCVVRILANWDVTIQHFQQLSIWHNTTIILITVFHLLFTNFCDRFLTRFFYFTKACCSLKCYDLALFMFYALTKLTTQQRKTIHDSNTEYCFRGGPRRGQQKVIYHVNHTASFSCKWCVSEFCFDLDIYTNEIKR